MEILREAGLPDGVINFVPGPSAALSATRCSAHRDLAGIHFTGSTGVFQQHVARRSARTSRATAPTRASSARPAARTSSSRTRRADPEALAVAIVRGGFEYQGQKCSAASRVYVPESLWKGGLRDRVLAHDRRARAWATWPTSATSWARSSTSKSFEQHRRLHRSAREGRRRCKILAGGEPDDARGLVRPADAGRERRSRQPKLMREEIFGPVVTVYVYPDDELERDAASSSTTTSPYALTGAIFARDRGAIAEARRARCATRPATSTSTTSPPAPSSGSSRSAARAPRAPTTRPAACGT